MTTPLDTTNLDFDQMRLELGAAILELDARTAVIVQQRAEIERLREVSKTLMDCFDVDYDDELEMETMWPDTTPAWEQVDSDYNRDKALYKMLVTLQKGSK